MKVVRQNDIAGVSAFSFIHLHPWHVSIEIIIRADTQEKPRPSFAVYERIHSHRFVVVPYCDRKRGVVHAALFFVYPILL